MENVEKVVQETQANFEASLPSRDIEFPSLPLPRSASLSRPQPSSRVPRRILAASQIFNENGVPTPDDTSVASTPPPSSFSGLPASTRPSTITWNEASEVTSPTQSNLLIPEIVTPSKERRASLYVDESPVATQARLGISNTLPIRSAPRGSTMDAYGRDGAHSLHASCDDLFDRASVVSGNDSLEDLQTASICHAYPTRLRAMSPVPLYREKSKRQTIDNVYDKLLQSSSVKHDGQPDAFEAPATSTAASFKKAPTRTRKAMAPPVSSEDLLRRLGGTSTAADSVDELGMMSSPAAYGMSGTVGPLPLRSKDGSHSTLAQVRKAFKAFVPNKAGTSRRLSRAF